ncbi:MAG: PaaI family thioesterase [Pseudomonas sp.]|uniref:PaaI family thioesterase n=1 Tax=Halopseudomonas laoshanensis TaxID=2268758 RepID=UPI001B5F04C0|nr:PaaI family thioesterase [Pseudomonas sp.]MBQ0776740.1 PaaI family thioesterase [Pseudomonas sp.]
MNPKEMTGLQIMQAAAAGLIPRAPISKTIPMVVKEVELNRVVFEATANETHTNPLGGVHGGFAATVMDSITGCATHTTLGVGESYGTIELNVKMCKPIPFNKALIAEGKVINKTRRLVITEGYIRDETGSLYAYGTATCMILS